MSKQAHAHYGRGGFAVLLAMILLAVFACLAVAYVATTNLSMVSSNNYGQVTQARLTAEGGLGFLLHVMNPVRLPGTTDPNTFAANLSAALGQELNGTANLAGQVVAVAGNVVVVPEMAASNGQFASNLAWADPNGVMLTVTGSSQNVSQRVAIVLALESRRPGVFDYGVASQGQIVLSGHAEVVGVNDPSEASILSATAAGDAIVLSGSVNISGDLYAAGDGTNVAISGSPTVAGSSDPNVIAQHVHLDVAVPDFPTIDTSALVALATNVLGPPAASYSNIVIPANTNPTFSSDVVLNGVIYVEAPNVVTFSGRTTINGLIVTEDADLPLSECRLSFSGSVQANGVEALPDTEEFALVKEQTGTFLLAPGFAATFSGNFGAVVGSIAADQLTFTGTAEGVVRGTVLGLTDVPTSLGGHVQIHVDLAHAEENPAGFVQSLALVPIPSTYREPRGLE